MNRILILLVTFLSFSSSVNAQDSLTLEKICLGGFRAEYLPKLQALPKSDAYVVLEKNEGNTEVNVYDFSTQEKLYVAFSTKSYPMISNISEIKFSDDESKLIILTDSKAIYRHSSKSNAYVYDRDTQKLVKISANLIQEPTFNPQANKVAYMYANDLYVLDLNNLETLPVTDDGEKNKIINGVTDWVYEEEFGFVRAFDWNKSGDQLAFIKFDETNVPEFSMDVYNSGLYPNQVVFKYPKAGQNNAKVSLHTFNLNDQVLRSISVNRNPKDDFYIPRIKWTQDPNILSVQVMNRHQNHLDFMMVDTQKLITKTILKERDEAYVEVVDDVVFIEGDNSFIWSSEQSGFNHLYHYEINGKLKAQITNGKWDVTDFYGYNSKKNVLYYQSVEKGSTIRDVYSINLKGKKKNKLSRYAGTNKAVFSPSYEYFINNHSSIYSPPSYQMIKTDGLKSKKVLIDNKNLRKKIAGHQLPKKELFTIKNSKGQDLNAFVIKPNDFDETKKYPLLMYQYSGPGSQQVSNSWNSSDDYWHFLLATKGYIVLCVDGRGTGFKGADFKKCTQLNLGKYELEDQVFVAEQMKKKTYIDEDRIGIWGWSFGGFMSSNALFQFPDVFKTAIAVAPVTNWRFYDSVYTERYMKTPQENPTGYDDNSPLTYAKQLKGKYLLIHGTADDNVHVQNSMVLINQLVHNNKTFDWLIYPDKNHGIYGGYTRLQLYNKMTNFILDNL